jgi:prepilin-type N-terminal cleavage/methylation domain-containing protein
MLISAAGKLSVTKTRDNDPVKRPSFSETRGFTMVETAIVLLIISIVIAMTAPRLIISSGSLPLKTAAKKLGAALRYSRSQAINTGSTYNTIFNTEENKVIVLKVPAPPVPYSTETIAEMEEFQESTEISSPQSQKIAIKEYALPDGVLFEQIIISDIDSHEEDEGGIYQISFSPNGGSRGGEIILADKKERMYRITVNRITGVVTVAEEEEN